MKNQEVCFVVSTGRSGSQMIAKALGLHPDTCALHEPLPLLSLEAFWVWSRHSGHTNFRRNISVENHIHEKRSGLIKQIQDNELLYIESSYFLGHLIGHLDQMFDVRYIYLHRNGQDFVRSGLRRSWYTEKSLSNALKTFLRRSLFIDIGNPHEDHRLMPPKNLSSRFDKITWLWTEMNRVIQDHLSLIPDERQYTLALEDFDQAHLLELHDFLGLSIDSQRLERMMLIASSHPNRSDLRSGHTDDVFTDERCVRFNAIAGDMMRRLGYKPAIPQN